MDGVGETMKVGRGDNLDNLLAGLERFGIGFGVGECDCEKHGLKLSGCSCCESVVGDVCCVGSHNNKFLF